MAFAVSSTGNLKGAEHSGHCNNNLQVFYCCSGGVCETTANSKRTYGRISELPRTSEVSTSSLSFFAKSPGVRVACVALTVHMLSGRKPRLLLVDLRSCQCLALLKCRNQVQVGEGHQGQRRSPRCEEGRLRRGKASWTRLMFWLLISLLSVSPSRM